VSRLVKLCRADKVLLSSGAVLLGSAAAFGITPLSIGVPVGAFLTVLADGILRPSSATLYPTVSHGRRDSNKVALTFDDGPDPQITPRILDILGEHGARASFFVIGRHLERSPEVARRAIAEAHELGNHSWEHSYLQNFFGRRRHQFDMDRNEALIQRLSGTDTQSLYRPPVGLKSPEFARAAHARSLTVVAWSLHSRDTIDPDEKRVARRILSRIRGGDIVLMHDGHQTAGVHRNSALRALPLVLAGLRERGMQPVTVSDLLK
jgi:peptidoglycan/xylan/chitin deacetylase (PgdA/CDA1 family)